jgi:hypothetical protein
MNVRAKARPLLLVENDYPDSAARKVLLMTHVLVGGRQYVESGLFRYERRTRLPP